jgi:hypothetical protein
MRIICQTTKKIVIIHEIWEPIDEGDLIGYRWRFSHRKTEIVSDTTFLELKYAKMAAKNWIEKYLGIKSKLIFKIRTVSNVEMLV